MKESENKAEIQETGIEIKQNKLEVFDSNKFEIVNIKVSTRSLGQAGVMTIINSKKNGKRVTLAKELIEKLENPDAVSISLGEDQIAISTALVNIPNSFKLGKIGRKAVIYSNELVTIITEKFNLDFTRRVSITFQKVEYKSEEDKIVAVITMK